MRERSGVTITFVLGNLRRDWPDLEGLDEGAIARQPDRFTGGRNSWIAQGYLRLRDALVERGHAARLADRPVAGTVCVVHRDDANAFSGDSHAAYLVVVRADRAPVVACDLAIVQNGLRTGRGERFVPLWPQPGILRRDPRRPPRIRCLAYHGRTGTLPGWFGDLARSPELSARGVRFDVRERGWEDYRETDLVLAAREDARAMLEAKPATKVYNAWLAGVPVLAAPEPAYRELWRTRLDFIEVCGARDVIDAVDRLNASPALYRAMIGNGERRAAAYDVESIRRRWMDLLDREVVPAFLARREILARRRAWHAGAMLRQKAWSRLWRCRVAAGRWLVRSAWSPARLLGGVARRIAATQRPAPVAVAGDDAPNSALR